MASMDTNHRPKLMLPEISSTGSSTRFFQVFPKFRNYKLFITGESYAGMFIPAVAQHIMKENERREAKGVGKEWLMPLGGAAL